MSTKGRRLWVALALAVALAPALWFALSLRGDAAVESWPGPQAAEAAAAPAAPEATSQPAAGASRRSVEAAAGAARRPGSVAGVVRDRSEQPIAGARVRATRTWAAWLSDPPEVLAQTSTDARGRFLLSGLPLATLRLVAAADRFAPAHGPSPTLTAERPDRDGIVIRLFPAHSLQGRVLDAQAQPVAGAAVVASLYGSRLPWPDRPTAVTDAEGRFALDGVPLGFVNVSAWKAGLGMTPRVRVEAETSEVELRMDPSATGNVRIELVGAPAGTVVPLRMYVQYQWLPEPLLRLRVRADEPLVLAGLLPDQYSVQPEAPPHLVVEAPRHESGTGWEITAGATVLYRLQARSAGPAIALQGRVLDPQGRPVTNQELVFLGGVTGQRRTAHTGSDGGFTCESPEARGGPVSVRFSDAGWVFATGRGMADVTVQPREPLELVAVRAARLSGIVTDGRGQPVPGVAVDLFPRNARYALTSTTTDGQGRYQFGALVPEEDPVLVEVCDPAGHGRREGIRIESDREADGSLQLLPATGIEGHVRTADGKPVPGAQVWFRAPGDQMYETWSDREGRYCRALRPQSYRIEAMARGATLATTDPIVVRAGAMTSCVDLVFAAPHGIAGVVRLAGGAPANGFGVTAWPFDRREGDRAAGDVTDQAGRFRLQVDAAGEFHLRVTWPWFAPSRWRLQVDGETHTVQAGNEQLEIRLQRDLGSVSGRIVVAGDVQPVPAEVTMGPVPLADETAAQLRATPARSAELLGMSTPLYTHRMPLTAGAFRLDQVEDRDFVLRIRHPQFRTLDVLVSVVAGQETRLGDLVLQPAGVVTGRVCDTGGAPLADAEIRCGTGYQFEPGKPSGEVVARTGAEGRFSCRVLQPELEMREPQMLQVRKDGFAPAACRLDPAAPPKELQFRLPAAGIVRVLPPRSWSSGRQVAVLMRLTDPPAAEMLALWPGNEAWGSVWIRTEPLVLRGMPAGHAVLLSLQEGQTRIERTVTARSGEVTTVDLSGQ